MVTHNFTEFLRQKWPSATVIFCYTFYFFVKMLTIFGLQFAAVLDSFSSAVVLWRFCGKKSHESNSSEQEKERRLVF